MQYQLRKIYKSRLDYEYKVNDYLWLRLFYDYFVNETFDYNYGDNYSAFVIDYNRLQLRDEDYSKCGYNIN